ncbi:MAG: hypothetical protein FJW30_14375 [Acidobacteria bacterium]|nr:hypothetical protein [Acidobacteriota bacterium]
MGTEKRHSERRSSNLRLQVNYTDAYGNARFEFARARDLSETGCQVTLQFPIPPRTLVALAAPPRLHVSATTRYQRPTAKGYVTGLEFVGGFRLTANN